MIPKPPSIQQIVYETAYFYNVTAGQIVSAHRQKHIVLARHVAMFLIRELTNASLEHVGDMLGGRDHTTIMHGVDRVRFQRETDETLAAQVAILHQTLRPKEPVPQIELACA